MSTNKTDDELAEEIIKLRAEREWLLDREQTVAFTLGRAEREWTERGLFGNDPRLDPSR